MWKLFVMFLLVRLASVFAVHTFFVPDEYWQSLEVAHKFVFGYGHLTWEWREGIRSSFYPMTFAVVFKILSILKADYTFLIIIIPRVMQGLLSTVGDLYTCRLSRKLHGSHAARWTAFSLATSWFLFYCSSRTLINTTEMAVTAIGLFYYPWATKNSQMALCGYLFWASVSCLLRPTAAFTWIPLYIWHLIRLKKSLTAWFLFKTFLIGAASLGILILVDRGFYGKWVFSAWNFFHWNWTLNISEFYGSHPWHWYLFQGLPAVLSGHTLPFLYGLKKHQLWPLYTVVIYFVLFLSLVPHKEFRFLLPTLPLVNIIVGNVLNGISKRSDWTKRYLVLFLLISNVPLAAYVSHWHKRGQLEVMTFIQEQAVSVSDMSVLFLMPCHSTPFYSHVHSDIRMQFLTCEPKALEPNEVNEFEADVFFEDPVKGVRPFITGDSTPTHIVIFDTILAKIHYSLSKSYEECFRTFNNHIEDNKMVIVFCKKPTIKL